MPIELYKKVKEKTNKSDLPARFLVNRFRLQDENLRHRPLFRDAYWTFWYYLGEEAKPKTILDVASSVALEASCCVVGAKAEKVSLLNPASPRYAISNIKIAGAKLDDKILNYDLVIGSNKIFPYLDSIWKIMSLDSLLCIIDAWDKTVDFGKAINRKPVQCALRLPVGIIRK